MLVILATFILRAKSARFTIESKNTAKNSRQGLAAQLCLWTASQGNGSSLSPKEIPLSMHNLTLFMKIVS